MKIDYGLKGRVAGVTGATGVLCSQIVRNLVEQGVKVAILGHSGRKANDFSEELNQNGAETIGISTDVLDREDLEKAKDIVLNRFGTIDILINGAGGNKPEATTSDGQSFFDLDKASIQWVFDLNVLGAILTTQVFGKTLVEKGNGSIINISSMAAYHPLTKTVAYSAAKAAVSNVTEWLAVHLNQNYSSDIRVNAVAPGFLLTKQNEFLMVQPDGSPTIRGQKVLDKTPMNRYGNPQEISDAVLWLCSDAASFVNGTVIPIDGGFSAYWGV